MIKPVRIESILRMDVAALRRNTYLILPMCFVISGALFALGFVDPARRPLWWMLAGVELFLLAPVLTLGRLRYLAVIEAVQAYAKDRELEERST